MRTGMNPNHSKVKRYRTAAGPCVPKIDLAHPIGRLCFSTMAVEKLARHSAELFAKCFGRRPRWISAAPGRVNLMGEHTDYNDGFVLPMAIDRHTVIVADRTADRQITLSSNTTGDTATFSLRGKIESGEPAWSNYARGVVAGFMARGMKVSGFQSSIDSSVPFGG